MWESGNVRDCLRSRGSHSHADTLAHLLFALIWGASSAFAADTVAPKFLGAQSCASALCHGGADEKHNQLGIWSKMDFHTRAPATLSMARSTRIAETLRIADATTDARCTVCHNPFQGLPPERKGKLIGKLEGVSCESCHNAAEPWLLTHTRTDLSHEQKVSAGLRDLKNLYVRANTCVACHQNLDPELRAAGHPELGFELDGQCVTMPRHWRETNALQGAQAWFVGQAVALRESVAQRSTNDELQHRSRALAWLLGVAADHKAADELAMQSATPAWTEVETLAQLQKLAASHESFASTNVSAGERARRAENVVIGLERLLVALRWQRQPALSAKLDELFKNVQSRADFDGAKFAQLLREFEGHLKTLPRQ
jgi:hypothetical protein